MTRIITASLALLFLLSTAAIAQPEFFGGDKLPSYFEMDAYNHRYPETDTNVEMYMHNWKQSTIHRGSVLHGGWIEREYLYPGDPLDPPFPGAVLTYMKLYNHGRLDPLKTSGKYSNDREQTLFFILKGTGTVTAGGETVELSHGTGVFMPAGLEYQFKNTCSENYLEAIIVSEEVPEDFEPISEMKHGTYLDSEPHAGMHWAHISHGILSGAKWHNPVGFGVCSIDAFDVAQPHMHGPGVEEVWTQFRGDSLLIFGNRLFTMTEGTSFLIPPNFRVPHCSINHSDKPMYWLYMGCRDDSRDSRQHDYWYEENF
jgi:mannose-6-phosphate isomerase-like protein (cupin superfamily)